MKTKQTRPDFLKRLGAWALCLTLLAALLPAAAPSSASDVLNGVPYIDEEGLPAEADSATVVADSTVDVDWGEDADGIDVYWYVVNRDVTINGPVSTTETVNLILTDRAKLTINGHSSAGISVYKGSTLNIYGQEGGTGQLIVNGGSGRDGIDVSSGYLNIYGGVITATGGDSNSSYGSSGIDLSGSSSSLVIHGGTVTATGGSGNPKGGSGIDAGLGIGSFEILGGTVNATGGTGSTSNGDGISNSRPLEISGATVTASSINAYTAVNIDGSAVVTAVNYYVYNTKMINGILFGQIGGSDATATIAGNVEPKEDFTIPEGADLTIGDGASLTIPEGVTVYNYGTITTSGTGTFTNKGTVYNGVDGGLLLSADDGSLLTSDDYSYGKQGNRNFLTIKTAKAVTVSMAPDVTQAETAIVVNTETTANLTLNGVNIYAGYYPEATSSGFRCALAVESRNLNLTLAGDNQLAGKNSSYEGGSGVYVGQSSALTIKGDGSLTAVGEWSNHYEGGHGVYALGSVTIEGGATVTATGGDGGKLSNSDKSGGHGVYALGSVTIEGGATVTATGGKGSQGGEDGIGIYAAELTISGGVVEAKGEKYGIYAQTSFSTGMGGNAVIFASGEQPFIDGGASAGKWDESGVSGVIFEGAEGRVYGNPTTAVDFEIPAGYTLTIPAEKSLTLKAGTTVENLGTILLSGGTLNYGAPDYGSITGSQPVTLSGDGESEATAYLIPDLATLEYYRDKINSDDADIRNKYKSAHYKLTADIDMSTKYGAGTASWTPIGDYFSSSLDPNNKNRVFSGTFDGDGHTISNLYVNSSSNSDAGLFGTVFGGTVQTLTISGGTVNVQGSSPQLRIGGVAGYVHANSHVTNCAVTGVTVHAKNTLQSTISMAVVGGVVGYVNPESSGFATISGCTATNVTVIAEATGERGKTYAGGVAGHVGADSQTHVTNCAAVGGSVTASGSESAAAGGVVGDALGSIRVQHCAASSSVTASGSDPNAGGVVGSKGSNVNVTNCYYNSEKYNGNGIGSGSGAATGKTSEAFASGEVAWLLQSAQDHTADPVWGQYKGVPTPLSLLEASERDNAVVHKVEFKNGGTTEHTAYTTSGGTVDLPENPKPASSDQYFAGWFTAETEGTQFTDATEVKSDLTVYARFADKGAAGVPAGITVTNKTGTSITVAAVSGQEYSMDRSSWHSGTEGSYTFEGLSAGQTYTIYTRIAETATAKPSEPASKAVTTLNDDGSGTVQPDESVTVGGTTVSNDGEEVTITPSGGSGEPTTVTLPQGTTDAEVDGEGNVSLPGNSSVQTGGGPFITVGESGGTVDKDGNVTVPAGGSVTVTTGTGETQTTTIITLPSTEGTTINPNGSATLPAGSKVTSGGSTVTLPSTGGVLNSDGSLDYRRPNAGGSGAAATYPPVVSEAGGGSAAVSPANPSAGQTVTVTPKPDEGFEVEKVTVTDRNGSEVAVTANGDGTYSFTQPSGSVTITVTYAEDKCDGTDADNCPLLAFDDLNPSEWYHEYVEYAIENGLMEGMGDNKFSPETPVTRAQVVTVLWRLENEPVVNYAMTFEDVPEDQWYTEAVRWAASLGIVGGHGDGTFGPDDPITREQFAVMLYRYAVQQGMAAATTEENLSGFADAERVSDYAVQAMNWAVGQGVITGYEDASLRPQGSALRSEAAAMLQRFCGLLEEK